MGSTMTKIARCVFALVACLSVFLALSPAPAATMREITPLTQGWRFQFGDFPATVTGPGFNDQAWQSVSLPHTWNHIGGHHVGYTGDDTRRGTGWYRLGFDAPAVASDHEAWLQFDGASIVTDVWLNGIHLGQHKGAFSAFRLDASQALHAGHNELVVRTDNTSSKTPGSATAEVLPIAGDWFMFGGLYRGVSLITVSATQIDVRDDGGPGVYGRTEQIKDGDATIAVKVKLRNDRAVAAPVVTEVTIADATGRTVAEQTQKLTLAAASAQDEDNALTIPRVHLWQGRNSPYLYSIKAVLLGAGGAILDQVTQPLGVRVETIDPDAGFILNGQHLGLYGVAMHQDGGPKGWALSPADEQRDMNIIASMGANAVRMLHYQHSQNIYSIADRDGFVVWAEAPLITRPAPYGAEYPTPAVTANAEQQLTELIKQNFNHPSIAVWSIANEVNLDTWHKLGETHAHALLEDLNQLAKKLDPSRPTALASCCGAVAGEGLAGIKLTGKPLESDMGITDVAGLNRYFGWYAPSAAALGANLDRMHALFPRTPLALTEYGAGAALSQFTDDPAGGPVFALGRPHPEQLQSYLHEIWWPEIKRRPYIWASWVLCMFDFASDGRMEGDTVHTNDKGVVNFDRTTPKDAFYYYEAQWSGKPFAHLTGAGDNSRPYPVTEVKAYSNAARLLLRVNGRIIAWTDCPEGVCVWPNVKLTQGANLIGVSGKVGNVAVSDAANWEGSAAPGNYRILAGTLTGATTTEGQFGSDSFFSGGVGHDRRFLTPGTHGTVNDAPIAAAGDQALFQSYREGAFYYTLPLPNGQYRVSLNFFEPDPQQKIGGRVFDVDAGEKTMLANLDVMASAGGAMKAVTQQFTAAVTNGMLRLGFVPRRGDALLSSLTVVPAELEH